MLTEVMHQWEENSNLQLEFVFNIFVNLCDFTLWDQISLHDDNKKHINTTEQSHHFNFNYNLVESWNSIIITSNRPPSAVRRRKSIPKISSCFNDRYILLNFNDNLNFSGD